MDTVIQSNQEVSSADQAAVLKAYFPHFQTAAQLERYYAPTTLGPPGAFLIRWNGAAACHWSVFPFPLLIDGKQVVCGKPEASAIHPEFIFKPGRPDLFGMAQDAVIKYSRAQGWPLLIGKTTPEQQRSMKKKGFVGVEMPAVRVYWPLGLRASTRWFAQFVERRFPKMAEISSGLNLVASAPAGAALAMRARMLAPGSALTLSPIDQQQRAALVQQPVPNEWPERRITVARDFAYFLNRFDASGSHIVLSVKGEHDSGIAILRIVNHEIWIQDVSPSALMLKKEFWGALIKYIARHHAAVLAVCFYLNDPHHAAAVDFIRQSLKGMILRPTTMIYSVLCFDERMKFALDPAAWAGSSLLMAGF